MRKWQIHQKKHHTHVTHCQQKQLITKYSVNQIITYEKNNRTAFKRTKFDNIVVVERLRSICQQKPIPTISKLRIYVRITWTFSWHNPVRRYFYSYWIERHSIIQNVQTNDIPYRRPSWSSIHLVNDSLVSWAYSSILIRNHGR